MALTIKCPGCQQSLKIPDAARGKKVKCPKCSKLLSIGAGKPADKISAAQPPAAKGAGSVDAASVLKIPPAAGKPNTTIAAGAGADLRLPEKIAIECPGCQRSLKLASTLAGKRIKCPQCQQVVAVPAKSAVAATSQNVAARSVASEPLSSGDPFSDPFADNQTAAVGNAGAFDSNNDPFGSDVFGGASSSMPNQFNAFTRSTSQFSVAAPVASSVQASSVATVGQSVGQTVANPKPKRNQADDAVIKGMIYRMPAMIGIGCAVLNLLICLTATGLGCVSWFPRLKAIGLIIFVAASTIGAQVYAINGFIGILNMSDRHGGIQAARGILACPFITAIVLGLGLGPFGLPLAAAAWIFMLLYNWPIGWWLWLMLEKKEAARDFDEVDNDNDDVKMLLAEKSKQPAAAAAPVWSPVGVPVKPAEEEPEPEGMSPELKVKLMLGGGALAAVLLVGGVIMVAIMAVAGAGGGEDASAPPPPDGWYQATAAGVSMAFPSEPVEPEMGIGDMEAWVCESEATESFFLFAAAPSGSPLSVEGLGKNTGRRLGGDLLGPREFTRGEMTGMQGKLSVSFKFPDMMVESYQHEGRTVIIGYLSGSSQRSRAGDNMTRAASPEEEQFEMETFYDSIHFAPPGFFGY
ncbi:MAG: hypothetical protein R3C05_05410 [Pirellulaceae bacterium]